MKDLYTINKAFLGISLLIFLLPQKANSQSELRSFFYVYEDSIKIEQLQNKYFAIINPNKEQLFIEKSIREMLDIKEMEWIGIDRVIIDTKVPLNLKQSKANLNLDENVVFIKNMYKLESGTEIGFTNEIAITSNDILQEVLKEELLSKYDLSFIKKTRIYELYTVPDSIDVIATANELYESGLFEIVCPNIITRINTDAVDPNDPYFQYQIALHNTGQTFNGHTGTVDADIDAPEAWEISLGEDVVVAVIDPQGVTSNHYDLPNSRQVRLNGSNFSTGDPNDPSPVGDENHGNACAGIIGATMNNNQGIVGVAPSCHIMPIKFSWDLGQLKIADAIEFAIDNGADIISCSWGTGASEEDNDILPYVTIAIQLAINEGVVVVFSAGNTARHNTANADGWVHYPGNADINWLVTVGASDRYDYQADYSPTSSLLDIVAPSHRAYPPEHYSPATGGISGETMEMWTIDIPGSSGYNPIPSSYIHPPATDEELPGSGTNYLHYTGRWGGTSFATPVVAGVAALLLAENPYLSPKEVYQTLTGTADEIGGYTYYYGGPSGETGYGRVNAYSALSDCTTERLADETISQNTTVEDCYVIIEDVIVTSGAVLTIEPEKSFTIGEEFTVNYGSSFSVEF